jgi:Ca-activated chloride channel family protein
MTFEWPFMLYGVLVLPAFVWVYRRLLRLRPKRAVLIPNLEMLVKASSYQSRSRRWVPIALYLLSLAAIFIGLARPVAPLPVPATQGVVVLSMDVSRSMLAEDLPPNRMEAAKVAAREFVHALPRGFRVGLVTFSSYATTVVPPTTDKSKILDAIDLLNTEFATAIGDGLLEAVWNLPGRQRPPMRSLVPQAPAPLVPPVTPGIVVLMSDGQSNRGTLPSEAAQIARDQQAKVYTIGIGTPEGTFLTIGGRSIWVRLDEETLRGIAEITGGTYRRTTNVAELRRVYRELGREVGWERRPTEVTAVAAGVALAFLVGAVAASFLSVHRIV